MQKRLAIARLLFFILTFCLLQAGCSTSAGDAVIERSYYQDETGQLTQAEVQDRSFTPYSGIFHKGYQRHGAFWFKLKLKPGNPDESPYILQLRPHYLNHIQLFDSADFSLVPRRAGADHPWSSTELPLLSHAFLLKKTWQPREVFLRIETVHAYQVDIQALEKIEAEHAERKLEWTAMVYAVATVLGFIWALVSYLRHHDRVLGVFVVSQFFVVLFGLFYNGFMRATLDGLIAAPDLAALSRVVFIATVLAGIFFYRILLAEYPLPRLFTIPMNMFTALSVLALGLLAMGEPSVALNLNAHALLGFSATAFLATWVALGPLEKPSPGQLPRWSIRLVCSLFFLVVTLGVTSLLDWRAVDRIPIYIYLLHALLSTVVVGALLAYRDLKIAEQRTEELATARQRAQQERRSRVEQNQFVSMLNHELKTPLSILKLLVANHPKKALAESTIDEMTMLLERCLMDDRLSNDRPLERSDFSPSDVLTMVMQKIREAERIQVSASEDSSISGDPDLYAVMVTNLLDNALKYSPKGSSIHVSLGSEWRSGRRFCCLSVSNLTGRAGTPNPDKVFEKYYRAESAKSMPGTGLGLYLVKSFAQLHGGDIACTIDPGTICFTLCLPY